MAGVDVYGALFAFQGEAPTVAKGAFNPFHKSKYATLPSIWEEIQPLLQKHGLILFHKIHKCDGAAVGVEAVLRHVESGTEITCYAEMPLVKTDPQAVGSGCTYGRRYTTCALLNLQVDEDDDGNKAAGKVVPIRPRPTPAPAPEPAEEDPVDAAHQGGDVTVEDVCRTFAKDINTVDELRDWYKANSKGLSKDDRETLKRVLAARKKEIEDGA